MVQTDNAINFLDPNEQIEGQNKNLSEDNKTEISVH